MAIAKAVNVTQSFNAENEYEGAVAAEASSLQFFQVSSDLGLQWQPPSIPKSGGRLRFHNISTRSSGRIQREPLEVRNFLLRSCT